MRYLFIDDDEDFSVLTMEILERKFPVMRGNGELILSEKTFLDRLASAEEFDYAFAILDIMVRWSSASDESSPEPKLVEGGYLRAGMRILRSLRNDRRGATLPVIIHTARGLDRLNEVMAEWKIPYDHLAIVRKWGDLHELEEAVRRQLDADPS